MRLRNFEAVIDHTYNYGQITEICGTNGTGKTTLFNAFTFALYGKDSNGRADFGFKRRDSDGNVVHNAEYGVELVFDKDGKERVFERVVTEKWVKPRGASEKVLSGHETVYYVDRVRCNTMKEYIAAVNEIAMEDVLRMLTDTFYFMSLGADTKKAMLLKMAYGTEDSIEADKMVADDVVKKMPEFATFVADLNGITLREFNATIQGKINAIKAELNDIPIRIASKIEAKPAEEDWDDLQAIIDENRAAIAEIDKQIADDDARKTGSEQKKNALRAELSNLELELVKAQNAVRQRVDNEEHEKRQALANAESDYSIATRIYNSNAEQMDGKKREREQTAARYDTMIAEAEKIVDGYEAKVTALRDQYKAIVAGTYSYAPNEMECPTCHRPYDMDKLAEQKKAENVALGTNVIKVLLPQAKEQVEILKHKKAEVLAQIDKELTDIENNMLEARNKIDAAYKWKAEINFIPADVNALCKSDPKCVGVSNAIAVKRKQIDEFPAIVSDHVLLDTKHEAEDKLNQLQQKLGTRNIIINIDAQIAELEAKQKALNNELGKLEKQQDTAKEFQKAKDRELLAKVNGLFTRVTWDFVSEQLNGNDKITCNCYMDGKPYGECNHALQVNAGLDIINAISRNQNIYLPIFIDNAESVVEYMPTESQMILLKVDGSAKELTFNIK